MSQGFHSGRVQVRRVNVIFTVFVCLLGLSGVLSAADLKPVVAHATGSITSQSDCTDPEHPNQIQICQVSTVSGTATRLGALTGVLNEKVLLATGAYAGTAVFTIANGDTISTMFIGQVISNPDGSAVFIESHTITAGTGKYASPTGTLQVVGTATADGHLVIDGVGAISR